MRAAVGTLAGRLAEHAHAALARALEPEHEPQQRRLAAAVRPRDRDELARCDGERDVLEHPDARPVAERDVVELDDGIRSARASERLPQGGEVRPHDGEVVGSGSDLALADPLERVEHGRLRRRASRATVSASFGEMSVSKKTVVAPELRTTSTSRAMSRADGSASGVSPSSGICSSP